MKAIIFIFISIFTFTSSVQAKIAFSILSDEFKSVKSPIVIENVPRTTNQAALGICYAHTAATLMQAEYCSQNNLDCKNLEKNQLFAPLDLTRFQTESIIVSENESDDTYQYLSEPRRGDFKDLYLHGGSVEQAIQHSMKNKTISHEECFDFDKVLVKPNDWMYNLKGWERLEAIFNDVADGMKKIKERGECDFECSEAYYLKASKTHSPEIKKYIHTQLNEISISRALNRNSYGEFIDRITGLVKCNKIKSMVEFKNIKQRKLHFAPAKKSNDKQIISIITDILKTKTVVGIVSLCMEFESSPLDCNPQYVHSLVINGVDELCKANGECRTVFKVINSMGQDWQDRNNDGWFDAETLLSSRRLEEEFLIYFGD